MREAKKRDPYLQLHTPQLRQDAAKLEMMHKDLRKDYPGIGFMADMLKNDQKLRSLCDENNQELLNHELNKKMKEWNISPYQAAELFRKKDL